MVFQKQDFVEHFTDFHRGKFLSCKITSPDTEKTAIFCLMDFVMIIQKTGKQGKINVKYVTNV